MTAFSHYHSSQGRPRGTTLARFKNHNSHGARPSKDEATLTETNEALLAGRSIFHRSVVQPTVESNVLISGINSSKIGKLVTKGAWAGMPIYTLTLEERRTCPTSCDLWAQCYGNSMPLAKRWAYSPLFIDALDRSLVERNRQHRDGFVVRLHVLGDFPDRYYVQRWATWLTQFPGLRVFGYTHHPFGSEIGQAIDLLNKFYPDRWRVRFSVSPTEPHASLQATTIWQPDIASDQRRVSEGVICPAQRDATATCGTCGLCWAPAADDQRIVFLGHGMRRRKAA